LIPRFALFRWKSRSLYAHSFNNRGIVFLALLLARIIGVMVLRMNDKKLAPFGKIITSMMARGLAAAVLATMPLAAGIKIPYFADIVFSIIILTNLATTLGVFVLERKNVTGIKS